MIIKNLTLNTEKMVTFNPRDFPNDIQSTFRIDPKLESEITFETDQEKVLFENYLRKMMEGSIPVNFPNRITIKNFKRVQIPQLGLLIINW